jgi:predicted DNA-binding transcriptional regulator AlpA
VSARVLTIADVCDRLQISRRSYDRMVRHGQFIPRIAGVPGIRYSEVIFDAWVNRRCDTDRATRRRGPKKPLVAELVDQLSHGQR